jgi:methionine aminopeptidase
MYGKSIVKFLVISLLFSGLFFSANASFAESVGDRYYPATLGDISSIEDMEIENQMKIQRMEKKCKRKMLDLEEYYNNKNLHREAYTNNMIEFREKIAELKKECKSKIKELEISFIRRSQKFSGYEISVRQNKEYALESN